MANPTSFLHCLPGIPAFIFFAFLTVIGCTSQSPKDEKTSASIQNSAPVSEIPQIEGGYNSLEELGQAILTAIADSDAVAFQKTRVTWAEYRDIVYANLSEQEKGWKTAETGWQWNERDSNKVIRRFMGTYGSRTFRLLSVRHTGPTYDYGSIKILAETIMDLETETFELEQWRIMNRVLVQNGKYKVIAFDD
jgi:hypothetical protein